MTKKQKKLLYRIIAGLILFSAVVLIENILAPHRAVLLFLYLIPYFITGCDVLAGCMKNIARGKVFDEKFLMTVATVGALIIGEYPESVFVMVFYQTGELFQSVAVGKSRKSISALMELAPDEATVIRDGREETVFSEEVEIGETVLVRAGEKIPVDGVITRGETALDMKALTGESSPVDAYVGKDVKAGSINLTGTIEIKAEKEFSESTAAKILELVENSTLNKAKTEKFLTRFSRYYTPIVVISALILAVVPSIITGNWRDWVYRGLIFLVVSCPCALVISVPLSYFGGIGGASKKGILIKGASFLEALGNADTFVFDKTGTLTTGQFSVTEILPENGFSEEEILQSAAAAEYFSLHPIAQGIVRAAKDITPATDVTEQAGGGVEATVSGRKILAGNRRFITSRGIEIPVKYSEASTGVFLCMGGTLAGFIALSDLPKDNAKTALSQLSQLGVTKKIMLTGDNESAARNTAEKLGITDYRAGLLPSDKAEAVKSLCDNRQKGKTVAFVGDGINDAPVLSLCDIGLAMGGVGSDAAIEAADIVIMDDNIEKCAEAVKIARKTKLIVRQNVVFALGIKFGVLILAALGLTNMWIGVFADVGVAVLAILNAIRTMK